ncbi:two-component sensor histidine kinase [Desulfolithobacter dissulfuricans]|uniref:histidine kinase n=1 Tax=Desulfolithobacter dissulfuricans TaxID=2795293 RepID=A0A915U5Z8_9BACT|nr:ATP-binding protein [Desulfolithobacter dissulfuricans]BCO09682.1 two-component sensor histidine kinase [Desulfolithobacter dissulfuricans]
MRKKARKNLSLERLWQALDGLRFRVDPGRLFQRRSRGNRRRQVVETGRQPFQLVKYFAFTSLSVILVASLVLSWAVSNKARQVLLARSEAYSLLFAENLNRQVFLQFVLPTVVRYGRIALSNEEQFARLDMIVRNITRGMGIDSVTIFDSRENIISYSTRPELVGKRNVGGIEYQKALQGENSTVLESQGTIFNLLPGTPPVTCKLKTYIPFRQEHQFGERSGTIMGVIEVVKDLSGDLRAIIEMQARIIVLSLAIMGMLFGVLSLIVARGKRILEERAEERRRLEEKLHEAQRLATLGKMVAAVSHEIKNPLGIVRSTAEILSKRISKVAPGNEHLADIIVEETTRLDNIVREFLDFARPRDPKMQRGSLNELILRATRFMEPEFEKHGVVLNLQLYPHLPDVVMDSEQIYQVLLNMMFNAVQAMPEGGTLTLTTRPCTRGAGVILEVADTGVGMEREKMEQIFTPFFTDKNRGTGLGLAIAKNIVEKHGGRIEVESRQGEGSVFTVYLGCEKIPEPEMETGIGQE